VWRLRCGLDGPGLEFWLKQEIIFFFQTTTLAVVNTQFRFLGVNGRGVKLTSHVHPHLHLVLMSGVSRGIPPLCQYAFVTWTRKSLGFVSDLSGRRDMSCGSKPSVRLLTWSAYFNNFHQLLWISHFWFLYRCTWDSRTSGMLRSVDRLLFTGAKGISIGPFFKGRRLHDRCGYDW